MRPPGHRRSLLLRRLLAAALVLAAVVSVVRSATAEHPRIVVFAQAVAAGASLGEDDVMLRSVPADLIPDSALTDPQQAIGLVATAAADAGEPVTGSRLIGPELINALVGLGDEGPSSATMVPVTLADPDVATLLRHGDTVSIVTVAAEGTEPVMVADGARVILAGADAGSESLLVALGNEAAERVAAASLTSPLAVVLTGDRAQGR